MTSPNVASSSKRKHCGGADALPERIARALGWRRHRAEAAIWGPFNYAETTARIIRALREAGATDTLAKFTAPIREALESPRPVADLNLALDAEQEADSAEDVSELRFLRDRTDVSLAAAIRAEERAAYRACALVDALKAEQERRARAAR